MKSSASANTNADNGSLSSPNGRQAADDDIGNSDPKPKTSLAKETASDTSGSGNTTKLFGTMTSEEQHQYQMLKNLATGKADAFDFTVRKAEEASSSSPNEASPSLPAQHCQRQAHASKATKTKSNSTETSSSSHADTDEFRTHTWTKEQVDGLVAFTNRLLMPLHKRRRVGK
jgi:hypothetical protein